MTSIEIVLESQFLALAPSEYVRGSGFPVELSSEDLDDYIKVFEDWNRWQMRLNDLRKASRIGDPDARTVAASFAAGMAAAKPNVDRAAEIVELRGRVRDLAQLAAEILASYVKRDDGYRGRVGQVQIKRWRDQLGGE